MAYGNRKQLFNSQQLKSLGFTPAVELLCLAAEDFWHPDLKPESKVQRLRNWSEQS